MVSSFFQPSSQIIPMLWPVVAKPWLSSKVLSSMLILCLLTVVSSANLPSYVLLRFPPHRKFHYFDVARFTVLDSCDVLLLYAAIILLSLCRVRIRGPEQMKQNGPTFLYGRLLYSVYMCLNNCVAPRYRSYKEVIKWATCW